MRRSEILSGIHIMNSRQRFLETMCRGTPDRVPCFDEGLREDVLERWYDQGLARGGDLNDLFQYDRRERISVDLEPSGSASVRPVSHQALCEWAERLDPDDPQRLGPDWEKRVAAWRTRKHVLELPIHHGFFLSMGVGDWQTFRELHLLELTIPDKPNSRNQQYRMTDKGHQVLEVAK